MLDAGNVFQQHEIKRLAIKDELLAMKLRGRLVVAVVLPKVAGTK